MSKQELPRNASVSINTTSTVVSDECFQQRSAIVITNTSAAANIYISIGQDAAVGAGVKLAPGGVYQDTRDGSYLPTNLQINAIADAAAATVAVMERILMNTYAG